MKKLIYLFAIAITFLSCDDGDLILESLNFSNSSVSKCGNEPTGLIFKINQSELLLLNLPVTLFNNVVSTADNPKLHSLGSNQVIYRKYNGNVSNNVICSTIPPASPNVINEWIAAPGGTIEVITTERFTIDTTTGASELTGYSHVIRLKNVTLLGSSNNFTYDDYLFGEYIVNL